MIKYTSGNILESDSQALVNTVNCEGYMGKGIAYQFKLKFPNNNLKYVDACKSGQFKPGNILLHEEEEGNKIILNFPTKDRWRKKSEYSFIEIGLKELINVIRFNNIKSISVPPLGCGNGGLDWTKVRGIMEEILKPISSECEVLIYEPFEGSRKLKKQKPKAAPKLNTSHLLLMMLKLKLNKFNKLRIQKAAYLVNIFSGQNYFKFGKNHFGPHAYSIDILSRDIREFQTYYQVNTHDALDRSIQTLASDSTLNKLDNFIPYLDKVGELVNSIDDDRLLELITTLIFLIDNHRELTLDQIVEEVHSWNDHKKKSFDEYVIGDMTKELEKLGIIRMSLLEKYEMNEM